MALIPLHMLRPITLTRVRLSAFAAGLVTALLLIASPQVQADFDSTSEVSGETLANTQKARAPANQPVPGDHPPQPVSREYLIKAAILFNFAKFASWPESAFISSRAPIHVCVLGEDPFGPSLETVHGKQARNRPLTTARIESVEASESCHILFVSKSERANLAKIIDYVANRPILTVADMSRFAEVGGIIALKEVDNRSRIEINLTAAEQAGVRLSSKLLRLADTVSSRSAQNGGR